jgi:hypothetical protein
MTLLYWHPKRMTEVPVYWVLLEDTTLSGKQQTRDPGVIVDLLKLQDRLKGTISGKRNRVHSCYLSVSAELTESRGTAQVGYLQLNCR